MNRKVLYFPWRIYPTLSILKLIKQDNTNETIHQKVELGSGRTQDK